MSFRIDVLDSSGNPVGDGPITTADSVKRRRSLDRVGGVSFSVQGTDPKTVNIATGRQYRIIHADWGLLGTFYHARQRLGVGADRPRLEVEAYDELIELTRKNGYFRRNFSNVAVDSVVSSLVSLVSGWSQGQIETGIGNTTVSYEGESVFEALDVLRDRWGKHFRLNGLRTLDFGAFGDDSGLRLVRAEHAPREIENNSDIALVTNLGIATEGETIINRVIPVGAGAGTTQLTLEHVTSSDPSYPVQTGTNADGSPFYYIEDGTSQTNYDLIERVMERSDIRPLTNSTANLQNAANMLYRAALAYLLKYKDPRTTYRLQVTKLDPARLMPGDTVRLVYRGIANQSGQPYKWVDVDADLWVLDIEETYSPGGQQTVGLTVATTADRRTSDGDILASLVRDTKVFKTHVQPNLTHSPVNGLGRLGVGKVATFEIRLQDEVLAVNRVLMRFITRPLRSSVITSAAGSAHSHVTTIGASGDHTHTTTIGASGDHTHTTTIGASGSHAHSTTIGTSGDHTHTTTIGTSGDHTHSTTIGTSGSHSHSTTIGTSGSHSHTTTIGSSGSHNHDSITLNRVLTSSLTSNDKPVYFHQNNEDLKFPSEDSGPSSHTKTSSSDSHSHPATTSSSDSHSHPATTSTSVSHSHPATTSTSVSHSHPATVSTSETHSHPATTSTSVSHSHPATVSTSETHSHPATVSTSETHSHPATTSSEESSHTHGMTYGFFDDTNHPQVISVSINGTDRTTALGGPWAPTNAAVSVEVDITGYINRGQVNTIVFSCTTGQGEIEFLADCLLTIQAITIS